MKRLLSKFKTFLRLFSAEIKGLFGLDVTDKGERVFIKCGNFNYDKMDIYQKTHYQRYLFSQKYINKGDIIGDMACGTGYGSIMLGERAKKVVALDVNKKVIDKISKEYKEFTNVEFLNQDLLNLSIHEWLDKIVSFETLEHLSLNDIERVLLNFNHVLKDGGYLIFSTPFMQEDSDTAIKMGFHKVFNINEEVLRTWLYKSGFEIKDFFYQNYQDFTVEKEKAIKDFIIGIAEKINNQ